MAIFFDNLLFKSYFSVNLTFRLEKTPLNCQFNFLYNEQNRTE